MALSPDVVIDSNATETVTEENLYQALARYETPSLKRALWQLINTWIPYFGLLAVMIYTVQQGYSYWITLGLSVIAAFFSARIFIFFHDCGHGSFFKSHRANTILGYIAGVASFTPYEDWQREHAAHHATSGDLDRRGKGDIWTATIEEYYALPWRKRMFYRLYRNPLVMLGIGPLAITLILQRFWHKGARERERRSVIITNLAIVAVALIASYLIGFKAYVLVQLPIALIAGAMGVWLFYVQHQFEGAHWSRHEEWDPVIASLEGSSYYKLPKILQWGSGNIGLHHIHHVRPGIPNYNLQQCLDDIPLLRNVEPLTIRRSLDSLWMNLWDEKQQRLVSFRAAKSLR
jgi:omega-6 fatty acid desaturase (delta-12 desaturase)